MMDDYEILRAYRKINPLILKALHKEIRELGNATEKTILNKRKKELEAIHFILLGDTS